jgi:CDP-4-dehydro-6-deoxyglucose reductase
MYLNIDSLPNLNDFNPVLSQPDYNWTGAVGYVQDILMQMNISFENTEIYACGSPLMINDTKNKLINLGFSINRFYSDAFVSSI